MNDTNKKDTAGKIDREAMMRCNLHINQGQLGEVLKVLDDLKNLGVKPTAQGPGAPYQRTVFSKLYNGDQKCS